MKNSIDKMISYPELDMDDIKSNFGNDSNEKYFIFDSLNYISPNLDKDTVSSIFEETDDKIYTEYLIPNFYRDGNDKFTLEFFEEYKRKLQL